MPRHLMRHLAKVAGLAAITPFALWSSPALANKKVALVIGNSNYQNVPRLANADASAIAEMLKDAEFQFVDLQVDVGDLHFKQFKRALRPVLIEVENGEQTLAPVAKQSPDLILMEIQLPIMDGHEAMVGSAEPSLAAITAGAHAVAITV
jgi:CheY-like chemotaxis protein